MLQLVPFLHATCLHQHRLQSRSWPSATVIPQCAPQPARTGAGGSATAAWTPCCVLAAPGASPPSAPPGSESASSCRKPRSHRRSVLSCATLASRRRSADSARRSTGSCAGSVLRPEAQVPQAQRAVVRHARQPPPVSRPRQALDRVLRRVPTLGQTPLTISHHHRCRQARFSPVRPGAAPVLGRSSWAGGAGAARRGYASG
jgi:hypothetical protein